MLSLGVTFYVKYLGSVLVDRSSGEDVTNQAIKTIITMVIFMYIKYYLRVQRDPTNCGLRKNNK